MKEITAQELKQMMDDKSDFKLIDVREPFETDICTINGELIPMGEIMNNLEKVPTDKPVVVHCKSGKRSAGVIQLLEQQKGYTNLINLKGGILAWAETIDQSLEKY